MMVLSILFPKGCSRKNGIGGWNWNQLKLGGWGGVSWNIHMNCTIKKDKIVLVVPPFSSSVPPPQHIFSWNSPNCKLG